MTNLSDKTTQELLEELERRKKQKPLKPSPIIHPNFDILRKEVNDYLNWLYTVGSSDYYGNSATEDEFAGQIFEQAMMAFYGEGIWDGFIIPMQRWHAANKGEGSD
jgi:hypothetical protein